MFTGIVRARARVASFDGSRLVVETTLQAAVGNSVAIDGVCLTVVAGDDSSLEFDVVAETLDRTTLGSLAAGAAVNVEPALRVGDELGGHIVQGHVDGLGRIRSVAAESAGRRVWIDAPGEVLGYCVEKGSVTVSGVSLTIAELDGTGFAVALVPHTVAATTLGSLAEGDGVNLEADVVAKYVRSLAR